ncbi:hypothetical protein ACIBG8_14045 [Nonomuraea sp. NPDC050556]|uniref:hypothetical protein n=1 Tax=Nonomuraea sp. NPDC050556 TaxID=3364369 RepID=UPI0037B80A46
MSTRWLIRLETLLTFILVIGCLLAIVGVGADVIIAVAGAPNGFGIQLRVYDSPIPTPADGTVITDATTDVIVRPLGASPLVALVHFLGWAPGVATVLLALFTLMRALRRARSGDRALFSDVTADLLSRLGWILVVGSLAAALVGMVAEALLASILLTRSYPFYPPSLALLGAIVAGFAALGVSEIVRRGLILLKEVEATI